MVGYLFCSSVFSIYYLLISVVKATDLNPANPGSTLAGRLPMSHWQRQEGHPAIIAHVALLGTSVRYLGRHVRALAVEQESSQRRFNSDRRVCVYLTRS